MVDWSASLHRMQMASAQARSVREQADLRERVGRALRLIDSRYEEALDLDRIARAACLSPYHFHRAFRRIVGETPQQYLTRRRIERARELLIRTPMSVTEVCLEVGFTSLGSFSNLFRRHAGHAPGRYRSVVVQSLGVPAPAPLLAPIPSCFLRAFAGTSARSDKTPGPRSD